MYLCDLFLVENVLYVGRGAAEYYQINKLHQSNEERFSTGNILLEMSVIIKHTIKTKLDGEKIVTRTNGRNFWLKGEYF